MLVPAIGSAICRTHGILGKIQTVATWASVILRALQLESSEKPDPLTFTVHYLRPGCAAAPCDIRIETIKLGRSVNTLRAELVQNGKTRLVAIAGMGCISQSAPAMPLASTPPDLPRPDDCVSRNGFEQGIELPILNRLNVLVPQGEDKAAARKEAVVEGWMGFVDGRAPDPLALPLFADALHPALFGCTKNLGWVPTLELTVHVMRKPKPGWIQARFECVSLYDGRMVEDGCLWDQDGNLVACVRQVGLVLPPT